MFSNMATPVYISAIVYEGSKFSSSSQTNVILSHFYHSTSSLGEAISHCNFELHFPTDQ